MFAERWADSLLVNQLTFPRRRLGARKSSQEGQNQIAPHHVLTLMLSLWRDRWEGDGGRTRGDMGRAVRYDSFTAKVMDFTIGRFLSGCLLLAWPAVAQIYVSPSGDDRNSGATNSPVRTLERARDLVRPRNQGMTGDL